MSQWLPNFVKYDFADLRYFSHPFLLLEWSLCVASVTTRQVWIENMPEPQQLQLVGICEMSPSGKDHAPARDHIPSASEPMPLWPLAPGVHLSAL